MSISNVISLERELRGSFSERMKLVENKPTYNEYTFMEQ